MKKLLFILAVILCLGFSIVGAEESGNGFKISPTRHELEVKRGKSTRITITVENITDLPIESGFLVNDFLADEDGGNFPRIVFNPESDIAEDYSIKSFVDLPDPITLAPRQSKDFSVNVFVPKNASPGSYFGVFRVVPAAELDSASGTRVGINASVSSVIIITVPGDVVELLSLRDVQVGEDIEKTENGQVVYEESLGKIFESSPDFVKILLNNEGNVITKPFGKVHINNWSGDVIYSYELNDTQPRGNVLPASYRAFKNPISNVGNFGKFTIEASISYNITKKSKNNTININNTF